MRFLLLLALVPPAAAAPASFFGGFVGVSTLSADGAFSTRGNTSAHSQYKPENGPTAMVFAGRHLNDFFAVQLSYGWNRNEVLLAATEAGTTANAYEQGRRNRQHTVIGEGMVFFRKRQSRVRPYLTAGAGVHQLTSKANGRLVLIGNPVLPPAEFSKTGPAFRVAVGIDVFLRGGFAWRYSFSETIQGNPMSKQLSPQGARNLKNFQNLFGFAWYF
ncbi:MAG TPA: outer membrane beta-barrel protein [Bryobacteraceae bacterium]|nr:outer membrane beta-barrel protein [Bryobacteraceae bacterium]